MPMKYHDMIKRVRIFSVSNYKYDSVASSLEMVKNFGLFVPIRAHFMNDEILRMIYIFKTQVFGTFDRPCSLVKQILNHMKAEMFEKFNI